MRLARARSRKWERGASSAIIRAPGITKELP
ncbi:hypothetical protein SAMN05216602_1011 [Pseudomonas argentinensis]|jgi:hypothetical protein|uniref:Uncharacterized protein n=1 Tax=Phytopseudomonas argentinensis TaxID=289370 RepID=A0A1I3HM79_9GAMM|nr:hypothetical protein SAMN05216602_1011 [Pseudomonas argentinensis]